MCLCCMEQLNMYIYIYIYIFIYIYISITLYHGLIKQISGITRGDLYVIETPDHTRAVDGALIDFINLQDN